MNRRRNGRDITTQKKGTGRRQREQTRCFVSVGPGKLKGQLETLQSLGEDRTRTVEAQIKTGRFQSKNKDRIINIQIC